MLPGDQTCWLAADFDGPAAMLDVREAIAIRGRIDLRCHDRLFPSQDVLPGRGPGNLIAAPLHARHSPTSGADRSTT